MMNILSDEKTFLKKYHLDEAEYNRTGLKWDQLNSIYEAYLKEMPQIQGAGELLFRLPEKRGQCSFGNNEAKRPGTLD